MKRKNWVRTSIVVLTLVAVIFVPLLADAGNGYCPRCGDSSQNFKVIVGSDRTSMNDREHASAAVIFYPCPEHGDVFYSTTEILGLHMKKKTIKRYPGLNLIVTTTYCTQCDYHVESYAPIDPKKPYAAIKP